ncbi:MAG: OmpA family protein [Bacteroidota bacterium]
MKSSFLLLLLLFPLYSFAQQDSEEPAYLIKSIYFGGGSAYIDQLQAQELKEWLESIPGIEHCNISIQSHTDNIGSMEYNEWLSQMRSRSVLQLLLNYRIPPDIISIKDFGEINPDFNNQTLNGRLNNRRVDVIIHRVLM